MPRKEGPPLEERMQRAKELFEFKQLQKEKTLKELYASRIYKFAKKTCIAFLWISQLILFDWLLPYREESDTISGGYFNANTLNDQGIGGITAYKLSKLFIKTKKGYKFTVEYPDETREPGIKDTIVIYKSLLLGDLKKMGVPRIKETFLICEAVTYKFLPIIMLFSAIAALFLFIKNIEVKVFAWLAFICTLSGGLYLVYYLIITYQ